MKLIAIDSTALPNDPVRLGEFEISGFSVHAEGTQVLIDPKDRANRFAFLGMLTEWGADFESGNGDAKITITDLGDIELSIG